MRCRTCRLWLTRRFLGLRSSRASSVRRWWRRTIVRRRCRNLRMRNLFGFRRGLLWSLCSTGPSRRLRLSRSFRAHVRLRGRSLSKRRARRQEAAWSRPPAGSLPQLAALRIRPDRLPLHSVVPVVPGMLWTTGSILDLLLIHFNHTGRDRTRVTNVSCETAVTALFTC